mgnify:CR=1 FL=1
MGNTIITVPAAASVVPFTPTARAPRDEAGTAKATKEAAANSMWGRPRRRPPAKAAKAKAVPKAKTVAKPSASR